MHRLFTALTLPLLLLGLAAAQDGPDTEKENLVSAVRSVRSQMTEYSNEASPGESRTKQLDLVVYNAKGNEVERTIYDDYGFLVGKQVRTHDANGNLIESVLSNPKGVVMERWAYAYADGKLAQIVGYDGQGNVRLREVNAYDEDGRLRETTYHAGKEAAGKTVYSYDGQGRVSELAFYLADGSRAVAPVGPCLGAHRMVSTYDAMDRPLKVVAYDPDGTLRRSWQYSYNANGQIVEDIREDAWSRMTFAYTYEYDSHGNWIKQFAVVSDRRKSDGLAPDGIDQMAPPQRKIMTSREIAYY